MSGRSRTNREDRRALRLAEVFMQSGTLPGDAATLQVAVRLRRDARGAAAYSVRMGAIQGTGPTLSAAILSALDLIGFS